MPANGTGEQSLQQRRWLEPDPVEVSPEFQAAVGGHPLVAQILTRRGMGDINDAIAFLNPDAWTPTPAESLPGVTEACLRIERAIRQNEKICVWGDFDVDGQTSTTLLVEALRGLGADVTFHIPVRARESHGVNVEHLKPLLDAGTGLVLTCDTGITAYEALQYARQRKVDVIVTDHHSLAETLPEAAAIVSPRLWGDGHPLAGLPGAGVAYKLAEALYARAGRGEESRAFLDLVAMGIVADVAEQTKETRYLLQRGLPVLREARRAGLRAIFELSGLRAAALTEEHIGFLLGPRLNALGRLDDANPAVELLTTQDEERARVLANHLEGLNARRRLLTSQVLQAALSQIDRDPRLLEEAVLVLSHPEWPAGVIGIVASELSERFNRPAILLSAPQDQPARGSARSIEGVNITQAIASQKDLLLGFGGHSMAAGLSMDPSRLNAFRRGVSRHVEGVLGGPPPPPTLRLDGTLRLQDLSLDLIEDLERLAPFGAGNPPLALVIPRLTILNSTTIGRDGNHLQITVRDERGQAQRVLWWGGADWPLPQGEFDLACAVRTSSFRGQREVSVEWIDARPLETDTLLLRSTRTIVDQRGLDHPLPLLQNLLADSSLGNAMIWAEGEARERLAAAGIAACDRAALAPAPVLVIWSAPPGRSELEAALEAVEPSTVIVFGIQPAAANTELFLKRLAGMARYAFEKMEGRAPLARLAAATASRESAVRLGLQWLEQRGLVAIHAQEAGELLLQAGAGQANNSSAALLMAQLTTLLEETAAYRHYFQSAEKDYLL